MPPGGRRIFTLAHISDLHATPVAPGSPAPLLGKRGLGWLSWQVRRRRIYRPQVLEALLRDLQSTRPDHLAITGDLTNVSLEEEFVAAREWLLRLGPPHAVTAIPGNHDAYVPVPASRSWSLWSEYLASDAAGRDRIAAHAPRPEREGGLFPSVRVVGPLALIGLCSAEPTGLLHASGIVGPEQLEGLEALLTGLGREGLLRVVLLHHPPQPGATVARRALRDAAALCGVLERSGAELVLHGHLHRTRIGSLPGPSARIPVVGVRSASHSGGKAGRIARYHLYDIDPESRTITLRAREYSAEHDAFRDAEEEPLRLGG